jgi:hypothetical protein
MENYNFNKKIIKNGKIKKKSKLKIIIFSFIMLYLQVIVEVKSIQQKRE